MASPIELVSNIGTTLKNRAVDKLANVAEKFADTQERREARRLRQEGFARIGSRIGLGATALTIAGLFLVPPAIESVNRLIHPNNRPYSPPTLITPKPKVNLSGIVYCDKPGEAGPTIDGNIAECEYPPKCDISGLSSPALFKHSENTQGELSEDPLSCQGLRLEDLEFEPVPTAGISEKMLEQSDSTPTPPPLPPIGVSCDKPGLSNIRVKGGYATCVWPPEKCKLDPENPIWMLIGMTGRKLNVEPSCTVLTQKDLGTK